jgi:hypothetical protein
MSDVETWLSDTQDRVATAQLVLSEVNRGLEAAEKVEHVVKRARPVLRWVPVVLAGALVGLGVAVLVNRRRRVRALEATAPDRSAGDDA